MSEPKVTECSAYCIPGGPPIYSSLSEGHHNNAILLWREDYDAMRKELEELREYRKWHEGYKLIMEQVKS